MKTTLILTTFAATMTAFAVGIAAQTPPPVQQPPVVTCPRLDLRTATQPVRDGQPVRFTANISGGDPKVVPIYSWSISAGVINSDQGTATIDVDSTGAGVYKAIVATVLMGGFAPECESTATVTATIAGPAQKLDEYGAIKSEDETARLDYLQSLVTPSDQAYVIAYGGRTSPRGTAYANVRKIRAYLLKAGVPGERLVTLDGGYKEDISHELWIVPIGAEPPRPKPTVNPKEVTPPKPIPVRKKP